MENSDFTFDKINEEIKAHNERIHILNVIAGFKEGVMNEVADALCDIKRGDIESAISGLTTLYSSMAK